MGNNSIDKIVRNEKKVPSLGVLADMPINPKMMMRRIKLNAENGNTISPYTVSPYLERLDRLDLKRVKRFLETGLKRYGSAFTDNTLVREYKMIIDEVNSILCYST